MLSMSLLVGFSLSLCQHHVHKSLPGDELSKRELCIVNSPEVLVSEVCSFCASSPYSVLCVSLCKLLAVSSSGILAFSLVVSSPVLPTFS